MFSAAAGCYQASPGTSYHDHAIFILYHPAIMFWAAAAAAGGYKQQLFDDASTQVGRWQDLGAGCWTIIISPIITISIIIITNSIIVITNSIIVITNIIIVITITVITIATNVLCTNPSLECRYDLFDDCFEHQHLHCHLIVVVWMKTRKALTLRDIWSMTMQYKYMTMQHHKVWA